MDQHDERFLRTLLSVSEGRVRVSLERLWRAFRQAFPELAGSLKERQELLDKLNGLLTAGVATLPKERKAWDRTATPPIPHWLGLTVNRKTESTISEHRCISWRPELRFVADLDRVAHLDELLRINDYLKAGGDQKPQVPMRERSVELFGDEKRLDSLAKSSLFRPGRLSLETLRCFPVAPPLVWENSSVKCGDSSTILIIENHHTYWSFCQWNATGGRYSAIVYGAGEALERSVEYIPKILAETGAQTVEYFGDLDPSGVRIPYRTTAKAVTLQLPPIRPATDWYIFMLDVARDAKIVTKSRGQPLSPEEWSWLPPGLREDAQAIMQTGRRVPQELVGWEFLSQHAQHSIG